MVQTRYDPQGLLIQLETALHRLAESFWDQPYRFLTEADAVAGLERWVANRPELAQTYGTADDELETGLLHREYPTFFRLRDQEPTQRLPAPAQRGYYDLVVLHPAWVQSCAAEALTNRTIEEQEEFPVPPLLAVVEFKLFHDGWNDTRVKDVQIEHILGAMPGGTYVYSNSKAYDDEQRVDLVRLWNWIKHFGMEPVGLQVASRDRTGRVTEVDVVPSYHASGHANGPELLSFAKTVAPEVLIAVHTEQPQWWVEELAGTGIQIQIPIYAQPIYL
jgi:hypothetical protein